MAGQRRLDGDPGRLHIADLADHDHVRILTQDGAQAGRKGHADLGIDLGLADPVDRVFHRILDREDIAGGVVQQRQAGIERGGLARAGRAGDEDDAVGLSQRRAEGLQRIRGHAQPVEGQPGLVPVQNTQHHPLAHPRRQGRDAHVQRLAPQRQRDAPVLGNAFLGDVQARHHLDARHQQGCDPRVQRERLAQHPVNPHPHRQRRLERLQMDVRSPRPHGLGNDTVDQPDHRRIVGGVQQVGSGRNVVDQALQPRRHRQIVTVRRAQMIAGIDLRQPPVEGRLIERLYPEWPAERAPRLDQGRRISTLAQTHHGDLTRIQQDHPVPFGKAIGQCRIDQGDHERLTRPRRQPVARAQQRPRRPGR